MLQNNKRKILGTLSANKAKIKSFGVRSLSLFGSSARGEDTPESDLDFIVEFEKKSFDSYMDLKLFLEELFHIPHLTQKNLNLFLLLLDYLMK